MTGMTLTFKGARANFFDKKAVIDAVGAARAGVLAKQGRFVQVAAQRSIRNPPKRATKEAINRGESVARAPAGQPPYSQTGTLKKFLLYAFDAARGVMVIGPTLLTGGSMGDAPSVLEHGGDARVPLTDRRIKRIIWKEVNLKPRPYMGPALERTKDRLAEIWKDKIK